MRVIGNIVHLEKGEPIPVLCDHCKHLYQPPLHSETSQCPKCNGINDHNTCGSVKIIEWTDNTA